MTQVVVITGGSSGLGAVTARHLVQAGAKVVLGGRRLDRLQALAKKLGLGDASVVPTDVTDLAQVRALVARAVETHGRRQPEEVDINEILFRPTRQEF